MAGRKDGCRRVGTWACGKPVRCAQAAVWWAKDGGAAARAAATARRAETTAGFQGSGWRRPRRRASAAGGGVDCGGLRIERGSANGAYRAWIGREPATAAEATLPGARGREGATTAAPRLDRSRRCAAACRPARPEPPRRPRAGRRPSAWLCTPSAARRRMSTRAADLDHVQARPVRRPVRRRPGRALTVRRLRCRLRPSIRHSVTLRQASFITTLRKIASTAARRSPRRRRLAPDPRSMPAQAAARSSPPASGAGAGGALTGQRPRPRGERPLAGVRRNNCQRLGEMISARPPRLSLHYQNDMEAVLLCYDDAVPWASCRTHCAAHLAAATPPVA